MINEKKMKKLKTDYIFSMTDDTGMIQHSIYGTPDLSTGYTSDDNARALIMAVKFYAQNPKKSMKKLIIKYLSFLSYAQNKEGTFQNFMLYNREFISEKPSEDCFGRCIWALCYTASVSAIPQCIRKTAEVLIERAIPNSMKLIYPRAMAYVIIGLEYLNQEKTKHYITELADNLCDRYLYYHNSGWNWFEDDLAYCNATLPWAMIAAYKVTKKEQYKTAGFESLKFLESKTFSKEYFKPIGCKGWLKKGSEPAEFDEQPVEACETMFAFLEAYSSSKDHHYLEQARVCYSWYYGKNSRKESLVDYETGGCCDGITADGLNYNQGAESIVSFWMAYLEMEKYEKKSK